MSDSTLTALPPPTASSLLAAKRQNTPQPASGELGRDNRFSMALERRLNPAEQGIGRGSSRDAKRQDAPTRKNDAEREAQASRNDRPVRSERDEPLRERGDARAARGPSDAPERSNGEVRASDSTRKPEAATRADAGASEDDTTSDAASTPQGATPATPPPAGAPATDAAAAASLAALLPNVAALPTSGEADGTPLDGAGSRTGASLLEKLIAEAGGRIGSADAAPVGDEGGTTTGNGGSATTGMPWKMGADATGADAGAATGLAAAAGATTFAGTLAQPALPPDAQPGLHAAGFARAGRAEQAPLPQLPVSTPAGQPAWAEDVGGRLVWMVGRHESKAEIVLTPPTLGKLEVSIHVGAEQTTAHFVAATSAARDALEQAMPRLREVLQQAGISLGQTNVSTSGEQQAQQHGAGRQSGSRSASAGIGPIDSAAAPSGTHWMRSGNGVVDTFV